MKHKAWIKGSAVALSFVGTLLIALELIATSSPDYKNLVDGVFGVSYGANLSKDISTYLYTSEFNNTVDMLTKRAQIAAQLEEEGIVMLKNNDSTLPLKSSEEQELKVTIFGSRAFTFKDNAKRSGLRDGYKDDPPIQDFREMNVYAGICGSRTYGTKVTLQSGNLDLPVTLIDGLEKENIHVNPSCETVYASKPFPNHPSGSEANGSAGGPFAVREPAVSLGEFQNLDTYKDAAIVMIGRMSGEGREYLPGDNGVADKTDGSKSALHLSQNERDLITLAKSVSDKVIVLLNSAIPMEIEELKNDDRVSSVLWIGLPGSYGMDGVARVISGAACPSGSLPDVFAVDASASPAAQNFGATSQSGESFTWSNPGSCVEANNGHYVVLAEGIYDGYYYYETRYHDVVFGLGNASSAVGAGREKTSDAWSYENEVSYSFGYGLSYTDFEVKLVENSAKMYSFDENTLSLNVEVNVKNVGSVAGKKTVQLYVSSPFTAYDAANHIEKSAIQLAGFEKTDLLQPGDEQNLTINVPLKNIASYSETVNHDSTVGGYVLENAPYYFAIGNGAHEALNNVIMAKDPLKEPLLYKEFDVVPDADLVFDYNPGEDTALTSLERGGFVDGVNATLLNKNEDGVITSNQLQDANYNYYKSNTVKYLSRTDWQNTFPKAYPGLEITSNMEIYLGKGKGNAGHVYQFKTGRVEEEWGINHTLDEDENGNPLENLNIAGFKTATFDDERWPTLLEQIKFDEAHGFVPNGGNTCNALLTINSPEIWQADGPNGNVNRGIGEKASREGPTAVAKNDPNYNYKSCDMPCEPIIAATFNKQLVEEEGTSFGELTLWDNSRIVWAPGMNLHRSPFNSRNHEYYSEDPILTNLMGVSFVRGGLSKGAILSAKHFAFNTQESFREGLSQFTNEQAARELELRGFQGIIEDINYQTPAEIEVDALGLMTSFSRIGCTGVNAHTGLMVNILREEWGFKGLISTDFVGDGKYFNPQDCAINYVTFMACGSGPVLLKGDWKEYAQKAKGDPAMNAALKKCMKYYLYAVSKSSALNGFDANTKAIDSSKLISPWQVGLIAGGASSLVIAAGGMVFYILLFLKKKEKEVK